MQVYKSSNVDLTSYVKKESFESKFSSFSARFIDPNKMIVATSLGYDGFNPETREGNWMSLEGYVNFKTPLVTELSLYPVVEYQNIKYAKAQEPMLLPVGFEGVLVYEYRFGFDVLNSKIECMIILRTANDALWQWGLSNHGVATYSKDNRPRFYLECSETLNGPDFSGYYGRFDRIPF